VDAAQADAAQRGLAAATPAPAPVVRAKGSGLARVADPVVVAEPDRAILGARRFRLVAGAIPTERAGAAVELSPAAVIPDSALSLTPVRDADRPTVRRAIELVLPELLLADLVPTIGGTVLDAVQPVLARVADVVAAVGGGSDCRRGPERNETNCQKKPQEMRKTEGSPSVLRCTSTRTIGSPLSHQAVETQQP
jgi:hypothetical protein